jgi:hypothetical protein
MVAQLGEMIMGILRKLKAIHQKGLDNMAAAQYKTVALKVLHHECFMALLKTRDLALPIYSEDRAVAIVQDRTGERGIIFGDLPILFAVEALGFEGPDISELIRQVQSLGIPFVDETDG